MHLASNWQEDTRTKIKYNILYAKLKLNKGAFSAAKTRKKGFRNVISV